MTFSFVIPFLISSIFMNMSKDLTDFHNSIFIFYYKWFPQSITLTETMYFAVQH